jgi:hypothetical protein
MKLCDRTLNMSLPFTAHLYKLELVVLILVDDIPMCLKYNNKIYIGLLRSCVRIPPGTWMFVCCECCVLSGTGLCDEPITRPEESYRLWCVVVCDLEASRIYTPYI